jgi:hypothetical protein
MGRRLAGYVPIHEGTVTVWYGPGDTIPAKHAALIGDHAWIDDDEGGDQQVADSAEEAAGNSGPIPPPQGGPGSGKDAWAAYAANLDVQVPDDAGRDDIIAAIRDAGHPVE